MYLCQLPVNNRCCCTCRYLILDHSHPGTDGGMIGEQRGYICMPPELEGKAFSGWDNHGMCEMWIEKSNDR